MTIIDSIRLLWEQQSQKQKWIFGIAGALILLLIFSGWIDSAISGYRVRKAERAAAQAKFEANQALEKASRIASEIKDRALELKVLEEKRNAEKIENATARRDVRDAQRDYDRALREPVAIPSADQLCADLAKLGYPCR